MDSVTLQCEVDESELRRAGYHHEEDCRADTLQEALAALHQLAHPGEPLRPQRCSREPCRSVYDDHEPRQLRADLAGLAALP